MTELQIHNRTTLFFLISVASLLFFSAPHYCLAGAQAEPRSASFKGRLEPIDNISSEISGKTVLLSQPWVTPTGFFVAKSAYYFKSDGFVDSEYDIGAPWQTINANTVCVSWPKAARSCYSALVDSTGQAFLFSSDTKLLFKVETVENGDPLNVRAAYATRKKKLAEMAAREEQMVYAMFGLLGAVAGGGGFGGGGGDQNACDGPARDTPKCKGYTYTPSPETSSPRVEPISPLYGNCHNPMGC